MSPEEHRKTIQEEVEAAKSNGVKSAKRERYDRTTVVAFGLLFVLPAIIIVFSLLFMLPFIARSVQQEPSGATALRSNAGDIAPSLK